MAMLLALLPCSECSAPMNGCVGCIRFFQWLDVAVVHQGQTKGFRNSAKILDLTMKAGWSVASVVMALYVNERENAQRILAENGHLSEGDNFQYKGKKPFFGPVSVFTIHSDELERLSEEYERCVRQVEARKDALRATRRSFSRDGPKPLTDEQLLGPLGTKLKVAGRPIAEIVFSGGGGLVG